MEKIETLNNLKVGEIARVVKIEATNLALRRRIMDMGITKGVVVKVVKIAPLGDPVQIELRGYMLSIRKEDLALIKGEVLSKKNEKDIVK